MVRLTPKQRKVQRDYLTRRKNTLLKQGANNSEVRQFLGRYNFSGLSDTQLNNLYNKAKAKNGVKVVNGSIVDREYLKKVKAWYGVDYTPTKINSTYSYTLKSKLNQFKNVQEIRKHKKQRDINAKQRYIDHLKELEDRAGLNASKVINRIENMSINRFKEFIKSDYSSKVNFERIFIIDSPTNSSNEQFNDIELGSTEELFNDLDRFSKQFLKSKKR